jgi:hypothetical protein
MFTMLKLLKHCMRVMVYKIYHNFESQLVEITQIVVIICAS